MIYAAIIFGKFKELLYSYSLKFLIMMNKMPKAALQFFVGVLFLSFVIACNNKKEGEKTDDKVEDTTKTMDAPPPAQVEDTTKMDSADTKPVKTID